MSKFERESSIPDLNLVNNADTKRIKESKVKSNPTQILLPPLSSTNILTCLGNYSNMSPDSNGEFYGTNKTDIDDPSIMENFEIREQDRWLPIANVGRVMRNALPPHGKLSKEAKELMQECVSEFISFITSQSAEKCLVEKRKTLNGEDILLSLHSLGFEHYAEVLKIYLAKFRQLEIKEAERRREKYRKRKQKLLQQRLQQQKEQQRQKPLQKEEQQQHKQQKNIPIEKNAFAIAPTEQNNVLLEERENIYEYNLQTDSNYLNPFVRQSKASDIYAPQTNFQFHLTDRESLPMPQQQLSFSQQPQMGSFASPGIANQSTSSKNGQDQNISNQTNLESNFTIGVDKTGHDGSRDPIIEADNSVEGPNGFDTISTNDSTSTNVNEASNHLNLFLNYNE
ncbi:hypothetical protein B5S30_g1973 [[Candida] boidinii]|nr:hypothetical protein B5S30_g1973 [[Candida] boidinii]